MKNANGITVSAVAELAKFDPAVSVQFASLMMAEGIDVEDEKIRRAIAKLPEENRSAINEYLTAWQESQRARVEGRE